MTASDPGNEGSARSGAAWIWWGLLAAIVAIFAISVASALMRNRRTPDRRGPPVDATSLKGATGRPE